MSNIIIQIILCGHLVLTHAFGCVLGLALMVTPICLSTRGFWFSTCVVYPHMDLDNYSAAQSPSLFVSLFQKKGLKSSSLATILRVLLTLTYVDASFFKSLVPTCFNVH